MGILTEIATDKDGRKRLIADIVALIETEVKQGSGLSGLAIKTGYRVVASLRDGAMIPSAVNLLLNEFCEALDPLVARYQTQSTGETFSRFLEKNEKEATRALLSITDARAENASALLSGSYKKLRNVGERQVAKALPGVGQIVETYIR